jgi:hypothetical protein
MDRESPPAPEALRYLLGWFYQLHRGRTISQWGVLPISWSEIEAWSRLHGVRPKVWELEIITMLDDAWLDIAGKTKISPQDLLEDEEAA